MYNFAALLTALPDWTTAAFALIVPTTFIGGLIALNAGGNTLFKMAGRGIGLIRRAH
jgi:hypothetical protein